MFLQSDDNVGHSLYPLGKDGGQIAVQVITLAEVMSQHGIDRINFLKLDCEGAEFNILLNASDAILARIDKISMEVHPGEGADPETLSRLLSSRRFTVTSAVGICNAIQNPTRKSGRICSSLGA